jgi:hypothetical protein
MSSAFRLAPVKERSHSSSADTVGAALAESRAWIGPFIVFLSGLNFKSVPSMTPGAMVFEAATERDPAALRVIQAMDDVYADVRDGYDASHVHGELLERYVFHVLAKPFPLRIGACAIECDGEFMSDYRLDAATNSECPAVAVEAKNSERALIGRRSSDATKHAEKVRWVIGTLAATDGQILSVFATWAPEARFRKAVASLVGADVAKSAHVYGHEQVGQLPGRMSALVRRLKVHATT